MLYRVIDAQQDRLSTTLSTSGISASLSEKMWPHPDQSLLDFCFASAWGQGNSVFQLLQDLCARYSGIEVDDILEISGQTEI